VAFVWQPAANNKRNIMLIIDYYYCVVLLSNTRVEKGESPPRLGDPASLF
jgi:hypothetical protein